MARRRPDAPPLVARREAGEQSAGILEQLRSGRACEDAIEYRGYVTDEERQRLYAEASMLVLPSLDEGFGMPLVEAMRPACRSSPRPGARCPKSPAMRASWSTRRSADVGAAIERLLDSPDERRRRVEAGRVQAARFSWSDERAGD